MFLTFIRNNEIVIDEISNLSKGYTDLNYENVIKIEIDHRRSGTISMRENFFGSYNTMA